MLNTKNITLLALASIQLKMDIITNALPDAEAEEIVTKSNELLGLIELRNKARQIAVQNGFEVKKWYDLSTIYARMLDEVDAAAQAEEIQGEDNENTEGTEVQTLPEEDVNQALMYLNELTDVIVVDEEGNQTMNPGLLEMSIYIESNETHGARVVMTQDYKKLRSSIKNGTAANDYQMAVGNNTIKQGDKLCYGVLYIKPRHDGTFNRHSIMNQHN